MIRGATITPSFLSVSAADRFGVKIWLLAPYQSLSMLVGFDHPSPRPDTRSAIRAELDLDRTGALEVVQRMLRLLMTVVGLKFLPKLPT